MALTGLSQACSKYYEYKPRRTAWRVNCPIWYYEVDAICLMDGQCVLRQEQKTGSGRLIHHRHRPYSETKPTQKRQKKKKKQRRENKQSLLSKYREREYPPTYYSLGSNPQRENLTSLGVSTSQLVQFCHLSPLNSFVAVGPC